MRKLPVFFLLLSLCTCVKPPSYSVVPKITFDKLSADTVDHAGGLYVTVKFEDGDGDLGTDANDTYPVDTVLRAYSNFQELFDTACANPKNFDLFVADSRTNLEPISGKRLFNMTPYQIPIIPAKGTSKAISGDVQFFVNDIESIPGYVRSDTLSLYVMMRDQSGNCSNVIKTTTIHIKR